MTRQGAAWLRLGVAAAVGVVVGTLIGFVDPIMGVVGGWIATAVTFGAWTWLMLAPMDAAETRAHATTEDPSRAASAGILLAASLASLGGVGLLLMAGAGQQGPVPLEALLGVASVFSSWAMVHTLYATHYARLFYDGSDAEAVDFNGDSPDYLDFAYLAFTLGMTYQVSDTALKSRAVRRAALRHALLSFQLGAIVIACTMNLVVQLAS